MMNVCSRNLIRFNRNSPFRTRPCLTLVKRHEQDREKLPLSWQEMKKNANIVRKTGIQQFLSLYHKHKNRRDPLKWGDEIEYALVKFDDKAKRVQLSLMGPAIFNTLQEPEISDPVSHSTKWRSEYPSFVIEGTPGATPYGLDFKSPEANMRLRRQQLAEVLKDTDTEALCISSFARTGCPRFTAPEYDPKEDNTITESLFFPDSAIWWLGHLRYKAMTQNIRERRGSNPVANIPIFKDENTPSPFIEQFPGDDEGFAARNAQPDHIYMDCAGFAGALMCLQVTFQAADINEARYLYDQLSVICPMMMAVSASSCIYRGLLADLDCRYEVLEQSTDDRTVEERGLKPLKENKFVIRKPRCSSIDCYIANDDYNDTDIAYDKEDFETLLNGGVDELLAKHIAHLFIRDPIVPLAEKLHQDPHTETDHFENILSTNWYSIRFKPPPSHDSPIGWRVEVRPLDLSLTDFENAAYAVFFVVVTRAILHFRLNFYIPISKAEENFKRAQKRDAVNIQKFYFRKNVFQGDNVEKVDQQSLPHDHKYTEMSINTILNGEEEFPGLIPLIRMYVNDVHYDEETRGIILNYLQFISMKASGELMTTAGWIRKFVTTHPDYKKDSVVSEKISYDLYKVMKTISDGTLTCPELMGSFAV